MTIVFEKMLPDAEEFCDMRLRAGLSAKSIEAAKLGLPNSLYGISARENGRLIAMGRVVGDGGCNFEVVDVAVDPAYQGKGLGKKIMQYIDEYLASTVLEGSYVSMIADEPIFYQKLGYKLVSPSSQGMTKKFLGN